MVASPRKGFNVAQDSIQPAYTIDQVDKRALFKTIGYEPHDAQWPYHESKARFRCAVCGRRFGKALAVDTPIPTPNGWRTMGELEEGDLVFDEKGQPTLVTGATHYQYERLCYKVTFDDGSEIVADADHNWFTYDKAARKALTDPRRHTKPAVRTTRQLADTLMTNGKRPESNHAVQLCEPVDYGERELPLDPYVLGIWLGDGSSGGRLTTADKEVVEQFEVRGYRTREIDHLQYYVYGLHTKLREMGLNNVNSTPVVYKKYVPEEYLQSGMNQRLELLQGFMDSDGTVNRKTGLVSFANTNKKLADAVYELACGFGLKPTMYERDAKLNGVVHGRVYEVGWSSQLPVFKLERKLRILEQFDGKRRKMLMRSVVSAEEVDSVPVKCISVANESNLFLAGRNFIPTHNSTMAGYDRVADLLVPKRQGWIVGPTYDLAAKEFRVIWNSIIIGMKLAHDKRVKKKFNINSGDMYIEMPWGARVECRSATHPDSLVGEGLDWLILSEAAKQSLETWEKSLRATLSDKRGGADFVTTPEGKNWVYDLYKLGQREDQPDYWSSRLPSWMNKAVFPGGREDPEIKLIEETTLFEWFMQEYGAEFSALVGRIYGEFSEEDHVLKSSYEFNPDWPNYIAFDWGFTAPLAAMEFQVSPREEIFVWREHYETNRTLEWHIDQIKSRENPPGYRLDGAYGDAADPEAVEYVSQHLVHCEADPESKMWLPGVRLMKSKLKLQHDGISYDADGVPIMRPQYHVDPSCENHIEELPAYRTKKGVSPNEFKGVGVVSRDSSDHSLDAMRYAVMHLFNVGVQHHLDEVRPSWSKTQRERIEVSAPQKELAATASGLHRSNTFFNLRRMSGSHRF